MEIWLEDVAQQLSLARILRDSDVVPGKRIAMILVDNVIEFLIKVHGEDIIYGKKILNKAEWEKEKRYFESLVERVLPKTKASAHSKPILDFHELRNSLYHSTVPLSVNETMINDYLAIAEDLLKQIFEIRITEEEWKARVEKTKSKLSPTAAKSNLVTFAKTDGDGIRFESSSPVKDRHAILLVMYGFGVQHGRAPSYDELVKSLNHSAHAIKRDTLSVHLSKLRAKDLVQRKDYSLTALGRKWLQGKFGLT